MDGRSLRLVAIFVTVLGLSAAIAALSSRSVEVSAIPPGPASEQSVSAEQADSSDPESLGDGLALSGGDSQSAATEPETVEASHIIVHVSGEVNAPGVVRLESPARVIDAVDEAGGPTSEAELGLINLAQPIEDGTHIHVPVQGDGTPSAGVVSGGDQLEDSAGGSFAHGININTATQTELETIPGVGPVTAQAIIAWREGNGSFSSVDQLIDVNGIGPKTLEQLRDHVRVS